MDAIEEFIANEKSSASRFHRFMGIEPSFLFIHDVHSADTKTEIINPFIVRPSLIRRSFATILLFGGTIGLIALISVITKGKLLPIAYIFILFNLVWLAFVCWTFFLNPKTSYTIIMDERQIKLGKEVYPWHEISTCLIETKGGGKNRKDYLVLFTHQNTIHIYDLSNLGKSGKSILRNIKLRMA